MQLCIERKRSENDGGSAGGNALSDAMLPGVRSEVPPAAASLAGFSSSGVGVNLAGASSSGVLGTRPDGMLYSVRGGIGGGVEGGGAGSGDSFMTLREALLEKDPMSYRLLRWLLSA